MPPKLPGAQAPPFFSILGLFMDISSYTYLHSPENMPNFQRLAMFHLRRIVSKIHDFLKLSFEKLHIESAAVLMLVLQQQHDIDGQI